MILRSWSGACNRRPSILLNASACSSEQKMTRADFGGSPLLQPVEFFRGGSFPDGSTNAPDERRQWFESMSAHYTLPVNSDRASGSRSGELGVRLQTPAEKRSA